MTILIDTDVAIHLRDGNDEITSKVAALPRPPSLSIISLVELTGGIYNQRQGVESRRHRLEILLSTLELIPFDRNVIDSYDRIVAAAGFSRSRILDRLIAATAVVHSLTFITINGRDFRDIPDLKLEVWPKPATQ